MPLAAATDHGGVEIRALDQDVHRIGMHRRLLPTDDTRERQRAACVGDDQGLGRHFVSIAVEGTYLFPGPPPADDYLRVLELVKIEGVQGLAHFHHDVVGHIDNIVDGVDSYRLQGALQPHRRRGHADTAHQPAHVTRAVVRVIDLHLEGSFPG